MPALTANARGVLLIAAITLAVSGWLYSQRPAEATRTTPTSAPDVDAVPELVEIPAGPFLMGSDPIVDRSAYENERWSSENYQGTVELPLFYISRYELTVAQFRAFVESTGYRVDPTALEGAPDHPVVGVSWPDALAYCRWLEVTLGNRPEASRLLDEGFRVSLPSEAEWEKAARGTDGRVFPWGNEPSRDRANYGGSSTMPVGSFACPECPFGLSDMSGNVWELTRSPYRPYPYDRRNNNLDLDADALFVMRGGSYTDPDRNIRAAIRGGGDPGARRPFIGFRVVLTRLAP